MLGLTVENGAGGTTRMDDGQGVATPAPVAASDAMPVPARGVVRLGTRTQAVPDAVAGDPSPSEIARLGAELAELRTALARKDASPALRDEGAIVEIRDAIRHLEAFFSITLPPKLDEIITSKLSIVVAAEQTKARTRRWLAAAVCANLVLAVALVAEMQGGVTSRLVQSASATLASGAADASAAIGHGTARVADLFAGALD